MESQRQSYPSFGTHRGSKNPEFQEKLQHMALPLAPLVQITSGTIHPAFPATLLNFWLLTDDQLEALAHFYHQRTPCRWSTQYPCPVPWSSNTDLETKRRRLGRFIGLRNCQSPIEGENGFVWKTEEDIIEEAGRAREVHEDVVSRKLW